MLEEIARPYTVTLHEIRRSDGSGKPDEAYRAINPHAKVPALVHDDHVVLESAAICMYLADRFPDAELAPDLASAERAAYLSWMFYLAADFEPALSAAAHEWPHFAMAVAEPGEVMDRVRRHVESHEWVVGTRFGAADLMLASGLQWGVKVMSTMQSSPAIEAYLQRCGQRPAFARALQKDGGLAGT